MMESAAAAIAIRHVTVLLLSPLSSAAGGATFCSVVAVAARAFPRGLLVRVSPWVPS
jgi:hypothetical protein